VSTSPMVASTAMAKRSHGEFRVLDPWRWLSFSLNRELVTGGSVGAMP